MSGSSKTHRKLGLEEATSGTLNTSEAKLLDESHEDDGDETPRKKPPRYQRASDLWPPRRRTSLGSRRGSVIRYQENLMDVKAEKRKLIFIDTLAAVLAGCIIMGCYVENENFYTNQNKSTDWGNSIRGVIMFLTCLLDACIIVHYLKRLSIYKLKKEKSEEETLRSTGLLKTMIAELILCSLVCPPKFDYTFSGRMLSGTYTYSWNAIICVIGLCKFYLIIRLYGHYSRWTGEEASTIGRKFNVTPNSIFALKADLKYRPYTMLFIWMCTSVFILGFAIRTFEMPFSVDEEAEAEGAIAKTSTDFGHLSNAMWMTIITMTTVGYGDAYPSTHLGRAIAVVACLFGMLLVSLMVVSLTVHSEFTNEENKAYVDLKKQQLRRQVKMKAANVIVTAFRLHNVTKSKKSANKMVTKFVWLTKMRQNLAGFKNDFKAINSAEVNIDDLLNNLRNKLARDVNEIKNIFFNMTEAEAKLLIISKKQDSIQGKLEDISSLQLNIGQHLIRLYQEGQASKRN